MAGPRRAPHSQTNGQSTTEQVLLIAAVAAALIGMQLYLRLAIQGRLHTARMTLSGRETPFYTESNNGSQMRAYGAVMVETVTSRPERPVPVVDPLRGLSENRVLTNYTATTDVTEITVTR